MFWSIIYAYITVNFYWSELDTSSGQIYCTLDILDIVHLLVGKLFIDIADIYCFGTGLPISRSKHVFQYRHFK